MKYKSHKHYHQMHKLCPECGSPYHSSTYTGYVLTFEKVGDTEGTMKDENRVECICGWTGITHDLLQEEKQ